MNLKTEQPMIKKDYQYRATARRDWYLWHCRRPKGSHQVEAIESVSVQPLSGQIAECTLLLRNSGSFGAKEVPSTDLPMYACISAP